MRRYAWWLLAAHGLAASVLYSLAAHAPLREPWVVPASTLDARIPMIPASAWVYATYVLLLPAVVLFGRNRPGFSRVFVTGVVCALSNALIYILFPTSLAERVHAPPGTLLAAIQALDSTLCALPSGHVALPTSLTVASALQFTKHREWGGWTNVLAVWTIALSGSTLVTKQHYLADVGAGALFGAGVALAVGRVRWHQLAAGARALSARPRLDEAA